MPPRTLARELAATLLAAAQAAQPAMLRELRTLVEQESPTEDKAAVDRAGELVAASAQALGGRIRVHRFQKFGNSLEIDFAPPRTRKPQAAPDLGPTLLLGHLDTVWPAGTLRSMPWRASAGRIYGPGVLDMKAGVMMMLWAMRLLREAGQALPPVKLLLHGEEEVGSPASRGLTEQIAPACRAVYVLEPAQGQQGAYKTARKGVGHYRLTVRGVAAHAGVDFARGRSAILELAHQLPCIAALCDPARGITLNPGVVGGGTRSNVVAAEAWCEIDLRIARVADAQRVDRALHRLRPRDPACSLSWEGGLNRPPMERRSGTVRLFRQAQRAASALGFPLEEAATGGGSDGNFTAALSVPTLDGMGAVGEGAHASHEHLELAHLAPRTALLAAMLLPPG